MGILENIKIAFTSLLVNRMRSLLTTIGIIIGIAAVILIVSIGRGGEQLLKEQMAGDEETIELYYQPTDEELQNNPNVLDEPKFMEQDIRELSTISGVEEVLATSKASSTLTYHSKTAEAAIVGVEKKDITETVAGSHFTSFDFEKSRKVGVIDAGLSRELFSSHEEAVDQTIWVADQPIKIIGVSTSEEGLFSGGGAQISLPKDTYKSIMGSSNYSEVKLKVSDINRVEDIGNEAVTLLNERHAAEDAFQVLNMEEISQGISRIAMIMTYIIGAIASISLFVGGIGVMNMMLVSVSERTNEIGIRRALGATRKQILFQFLIESLILSLVGGLIGIGIGYMTTILASSLIGWDAYFSWEIIFIGLSFSTVVGIIFGILPARKASKLEPVEALRFG
ncbi:ABC transporter permease [Halobacillus sp. B23F22_1]|uniref:ABC transporter permease n=1 Tax=Halobacillus sp. B23F22_1 TaxID=3459514 RepID=UPI00373E8B2F